MIVFRKKPLPIEAVQFDGTEKSVVDICKLNLNQPFGNSITIVEHAILSRIAVVVNSVNVELGNWVVREGNYISVYSSDKFEILFKRESSENEYLNGFSDGVRNVFLSNIKREEAKFLETSKF